MFVLSVEDERCEREMRFSHLTVNCLTLSSSSDEKPLDNDQFGSLTKSTSEDERILLTFKECRHEAMPNPSPQIKLCRAFVQIKLMAFLCRPDSITDENQQETIIYV